MHAASPRRWDLGEESGDELVDIEGLSIGVVGEGVVARGRRSGWVSTRAFVRVHPDTRPPVG